MMPEMKEWTLMFYLASDNPLAPGIVSQLKALKAAGYHPDANVVTQFDPFVEGTPTHIFEVNLMNKLKHPGVADVGFLGNDPFVRNLVEDKLWREQRTRHDKPLKRELKRILKQNHALDYQAPVPPEERTDPRQSSHDDPEEPEPEESLRSFLAFCRNRYPAKRFALFILGHGVVVGNDIFLYDEHATQHSISLTELGQVLREFKADIDESEFELVSFHSCSVSSLEVAFELQDTANYMLASQGPAFVGNWPYRSILIRIFNDLVREGSNINVKRMFERIFKLCFFNAVDFLLAGYSFQLTLCDLRRVSCIGPAIANLVKELVAGLENKCDITKDVILLAHLKSQSFFQEMYTDLYDFCFCITQKVEELKRSLCHCNSAPQTDCTKPAPPIDCNNLPACTCLPESLFNLYCACGPVMHQLMKENPPWPNGTPHKRFIVRAEFLGPSYQYSRGFSVYFPWTRPVGDRRILAEYEKYKFHRDLLDRAERLKLPKKQSWLTFLQAYFDETLRLASSAECDPLRCIPEKHDQPPPCPHQPPCPPRRKPREVDPCAQTAPAPDPPPSPCQKEQEEQELREDIANLIYGDDLYGSYELAGPGKSGPNDPAGGSGDCDCPSIKNYPRDTRPRRERTETATPPPSVEFTQAKFLIQGSD
jgi:hypothetical protein